MWIFLCAFGLSLLSLPFIQKYLFFFYFTIIIITIIMTYYSIILFAQSLFVIITLLGVSGGFVRSDFGCLRFQFPRKLLSLHACSEFNG